MKKSLISKKFFTCLIGMASAVALLVAGKIAERSFLSLFLGSVIFYLFVEGTLDLSSLKKISAGTVSVEAGDDDEKQN